MKLLWLLSFKFHYLTRIRYYWRIFLDFEDYVMMIYFTIKGHLKKFLNYRYIKRNGYPFLLKKDEMVSFFFDYLKKQERDLFLFLNKKFFFKINKSNFIIFYNYLESLVFYVFYIYFYLNLNTKVEILKNV